MKDNEFYIQGGSEKNLYGKSWIPDRNSKAVVVILHDLSDHINRYENFSRFFTHHDIATIGIDFQGHGKSPGKRGHMKGYNLILSNVHQLMIATRRRFNDIPIILYGQGLGGNIAINYAIRHTSRELTGVAVSSPLIGFANNPRFRNIFLLNLLGKVLPSIRLDIDIDPMDLSHDPDIGMEYLEDPLNHGKISIQLYNDMIIAGQWIMNNVSKLKYPILIMHGNEDRITSYSDSAALAKKITGNVDVKIWDDLRHELHHEILKDSVLQYILSWIQKIIFNHTQNEDHLTNRRDSNG